MRDLFFHNPAPVNRTIGRAPGKASFRADIQALRGVAVLLVVLYHSGLGIFGAGYLGVDMFFVISGFLITGIITRGLADQRFSFIDFYSRRVRRLLPAAYTMLAVTAVASALLLTTSQYRDFLVNAVGSVFFVANLTLWKSTGYFALDSAFQPLLHMWSLAIEEQYYLLLPLILRIVPRRAWLPLLASATVVSVVGGVYLGLVKPGIAFFWLLSRAWELGIGSIAALTWHKPALKRMCRLLVWLALIGLLLVPIWALPGPVPGAGAILICLAAVIFIVADDTRLAASWPVRLLAYVGDFSYSLYLVHWPVFAFARVTTLSTELPVAVSILLIGVSFLLAWLLYTFVEEPLRLAPVKGRKLILTALLASAAVLALCWSLGHFRTQVPASAELAHPLEGLMASGCFTEDVETFDGSCSQSAEPQMLLWGDSYSAHLVPGLLATHAPPFAQASKGHCSPFANYAAVATGNERNWSKGCLRFNASVIDYARRTKSLKVVVMSGQFFRTLPFASAYAITRTPPGEVVRAPLGVAATVEAERHTVALLRSFGLRVLIVSPTPSSPFNMGQCWQRMAEHLPLLGQFANCRLTRDNPARVEQQWDAIGSGFQARANVPIIQLDQALCHSAQCHIQADGKPLFVDTGHLTEWGSLVVGRRLRLGERVWAEAR